MADPVADAARARGAAFNRLKYVKSQTNDPDQIKKATQDLHDAETKRSSAILAARKARQQTPQQ